MGVRVRVRVRVGVSVGALALLCRGALETLVEVLRLPLEDEFGEAALLHGQPVACLGRVRVRDWVRLRLRVGLG